jgi:hypothetical protein
VASQHLPRDFTVVGLWHENLDQATDDEALQELDPAVVAMRR